MNSLTGNKVSEEEREKMRQQWRKQVEFACRTCGGSAYAEREGSCRWGCPKCGFSTFTPSLFFKESAVA